MNIYEVRAIENGVPKVALLLANEIPTKESAAALLGYKDPRLTVFKMPVRVMTPHIAEHAEVNKAFRVLKARTAMALYEDEDSSNITDLLTDLMHAAESTEEGFDNLLDQAREHYRQEIKDNG